MELLQVENLSFTYPNKKQKTLNGLSFTVNDGDFVVVCGETGCGKTTLLRMLKRELTPAGEKSGAIRYRGIPQEDLDERTSACEIGFVLQKPENQIVTDKVWHELAFGLENRGLPTPVIRRRVSEMASYFGIGDWFWKDVSELSGGQKQILNLASVMAMQPKLLILDEPTAQLDPIAAADFIATLQKLNRELSLTILLVEHRLEEVFPIADRVMLMRQGRLFRYGTPREVAEGLDKADPMACAMPSAVRLYHELDVPSSCPLTVKEGRRFIEESFGTTIKSLDSPVYVHRPDAVLEMKDVWFRYEKDQPDVLRGTTLTVYENEILCLLGGNAAGKTTVLGAAAGLLRPYRGNIRVFGKRIGRYANGELYRHCLALLPQDVQTVFLKSTVREDLDEVGGDRSRLPFDLSAYDAQHPYDLSGGEQQLCALAKMLLLQPRLLLLDEPTKGVDAHAKRQLISILKTLKASGMTVVIVTHDLEFAAECADRCALFFGGEVTSCDEPSGFFAENNFYTTAANRMTRYRYDRIVTVEEAAQICRLNGVGHG